MKRTILCILIFLTLGVIGTLSIYQYSNQELKKESEVNDVTESSSLAMVLIDENEAETQTDSFPSSSEYYLDVVKSYCKNDSLIEWDKNTSKVKIISEKADSCKLYFRKNTSYNLKSHIMATNSIIKTEPDFSATSTDENTNIYKTKDDLGTSYYFRGAPTNNYVEFGTYAEDTTLTVYDCNESTEKTVEVKAGSPMYWRIVRINGDGSIRLIYDGIEKLANGVAHTATIAATAYNENYDDVKYVGYTYDNNGTETDSTIKDVIDSWYDKHLKTNYDTYIEDGIFCNDRSGATTDEYESTYYAPYYRLSTNKTPVLTCTNKEDRYTTSTELGNGKLTDAEGNVRPIGLLTADETYFAGGNNSAGNSSFYLYSGEMYWTSTPDDFDGDYAFVWFVNYDGYVYDGNFVIDGNIGARPVINIKADILFTGDGSVNTPYQLAN